MQSLPNEGLYITRKRKKWKFAHFDSYNNCFLLDRDNNGVQLKTQLKSFWEKEQPLVLEIAAGNAQFSLALAKINPGKNFIAIDIKSDRLYTSAKQALEEEVKNIVFVRMHMNDLEKLFAPGSVDEIWLTFPDPHPKKRSHKHRLTHIKYLQQYRKILTKTGILKFKTDSQDLFLWSLEQFVASKWHIAELSFDLHESNLPEVYKIKTQYEQRFSSQGIPINYATCSVPTPTTE